MPLHIDSLSQTVESESHFLMLCYEGKKPSWRATTGRIRERDKEEDNQ